MYKGEYIPAREHNEKYCALAGLISKIRPLTESEQYFLDNPAVQGVDDRIHRALIDCLLKEAQCFQTKGGDA